MSAAVITKFVYFEGRARALAVGDVGTRLVTEMGNDTLSFATIRTPVDTGRLRAATQLVVDPPRGWVVQAHALNDTEYFVYVHDGTPRMPPRPFLWEGAQQAAARNDFRLNRGRQ